MPLGGKDDFFAFHSIYIPAKAAAAAAPTNFLKLTFF
jgi:hypothetical protein